MKKIALKLWGFLGNFLKIKMVTIHDQYFDYMTDNDDLEDTPTYVDVTYSEALGLIIRINLSQYDNGSSLKDIQDFYRSCHINEWGGLNEYKKYTIYKQ